MLKYVRPSEKYLQSYYEACQETWGHTYRDYIIHDPAKYNEWKDTIFNEYRDHEQGRNIDENGLINVPSVILWVIDTENDEYVGTISVRPRLGSGTLCYFGGSVGDILRVSRRGQGLSTELLKLSIDAGREFHCRPLIMLVDKDNMAACGAYEKLKDDPKYGYIDKEEYSFRNCKEKEYVHAIRYSFDPDYKD